MKHEIILQTNYRPVGELNQQVMRDSFKSFKRKLPGISRSSFEGSRVIRDRAEAAGELQDAQLQSVDNVVLSYFGPATKNVIKRSNRFTEQEFNLYEYGRIIDTEALVARTFLKKKALMFRNGFYLSQKNRANIKYINKRLREIALVSNKPTQLFLDELAYSMIAVHNAFFVKVRKKAASTGKPREDFQGKSLEPIAALFVMPPETIVQKIDDANNVTLYRQWMPRNKWRDFQPENIEHMFYNRRPGYTIGTPPLEPVRDDILALRRIEESVEKLIYKSLFPIIHVKVGTEKIPAKTLRDGTKEVDIAVQYLEQMEEDGGLVTNERVEVKAIGAESIALRVESYLTYFKSRVYAGLGMSGIDFGEASSTTKSSGEVLSAALVDAVQDYQSTFAVFMDKLLLEILLESGRYENELDLSEDDIVKFMFHPIDKNERITKESHILNMANAGLIMIEEARDELDYKDKRYDPEKTVPYLLQQAQAAMALDNQLELNTEDVKNQKSIISHTAKVAPKPTASGAKPAAKKPAAKPAAKKTASSRKKVQGAAKQATQKASPANKKKLKDILADNIGNKDSRLSRVIRDCISESVTMGIYDSFFELEEDITEPEALKIHDHSLDMAIKLVVESSSFQQDESIELLIDSILEEAIQEIEGEEANED